MVGIAGGGGGGGGGYNYVQDAEPGDPREGEEWYDTGSNAAFVYDGAAWVELTVVDHGQLSGLGANDHHSKTTDHGELSGIGASDHHSRYSDGEAAAAGAQYLTLFQGLNPHKQRHLYDTTNISSATVEYRCDPNGSAGFTIYENGGEVLNASSGSGTNTTISGTFTPSNGENTYTASINRPSNGGAEYWFGGWLQP